MTERSKFTEDERQELLARSVFPEQVRRLEAHALQSILWRLTRPPPMQDVRAKITDLAKALRRVERGYVRMSASKSAVSQEASTRLQSAADDLLADAGKLAESLEIATNIVDRALELLPRTQRSTRKDSAAFVDLILKALRLGHTEHFGCAGYGDTPFKEAMPPFDIRVTRDAEPFRSIVRILSVAAKRITEEHRRVRFAIKGTSVPSPLSGEAFDPDWAIRQYLQRNRR